MRYFASGMILLGVGAAGCSSETRPTGPAVEIGVAPLTLPSIDDACYRLTVLNGDNETVWQEDEVCSGQYGDGQGAISYIGPCDAQLVDGDPQVNTVRLELAELYDQDGPIDQGSYRNPCGHADNGNNDGFGPCELSFECLENQDVFVEFNLTVMRNANQGFFDIAVNFDDIFCSAKVDCQYGADDPIKLLYNPNTGLRDQTAVVAFACTAGTGDATTTTLFMDDLTLNCDGQEIRLDPTQGPGNVWNDQNPDPDDGDAIWQYATYFGNESLDCDGAPCNKVYWNIAIGFDPTAGDCHLSGSATASKNDQMKEFLTPERSTYPFLSFDVDLSQGGSTCTQNPLDGDGSGVQTTYTGIDTPKPFCHRLEGTEFSHSLDCGSGAQPGYYCDPQVGVVEGTYKNLIGDAQTLAAGRGCGTLDNNTKSQYLTLLNRAKQEVTFALVWLNEACDADGLAIKTREFNILLAEVNKMIAECDTGNVFREDQQF